MSTETTLTPEALVEAIAGYADDKKAIEIVALQVGEVLGYTDYFVICSGNTDRQAKAIHDGDPRGHEERPRRRCRGASRGSPRRSGS